METKTLEQLKTDKQNHLNTMTNLQQDIVKLEQSVSNLRNLQREGDMLTMMYNERILNLIYKNKEILGVD